jgi:hypothetical protein
LSTRYTRAVHHPTAGRAGERQGMEVCGTVDHLLTRRCPRSGAFRALHVYKLPVKCGHRTTFPVRCRHRIRWTGGVPSLRPAGHSAGLGRDHLEGQARNEAWGPQLARRARTAQSCVPDSRPKPDHLTVPGGPMAPEVPGLCGRPCKNGRPRATACQVASRTLRQGSVEMPS